MCIMEVRAGQRTSTIAQAMAHNVGTIERDLELFIPLLEARQDDDALKLIQEAMASMSDAYASFLQVFANEVKTEAHYLSDEVTGNERHHEMDHHDATMIDDVIGPRLPHMTPIAERERDMA